MFDGEGGCFREGNMVIEDIQTGKHKTHRLWVLGKQTQLRQCGLTHVLKFPSDVIDVRRDFPYTVSILSGSVSLVG